MDPAASPTRTLGPAFARPPRLPAVPFGLDDERDASPVTIAIRRGVRGTGPR